MCMSWLLLIFVISHYIVHVPFREISGEATPCGQLDRCNLQSFVYLRSLLLGLVTFCTKLWELQI